MSTFFHFPMQRGVARYWPPMSQTVDNGEEKAMSQTVDNAFTADELAEISGFKKQVISRFKKRLRNQEAYEVLLRGPSWRKAMIEPLMGAYSRIREYCHHSRNLTGRV